MTQLEISDLNDWIGRNLFDSHKFVGLKKRGLWYRPGAAGYTANPDEAGRYTLEEAKRHEDLRDEPVTIHEFPVEDFESPAGFVKLLKKCCEKLGCEIHIEIYNKRWLVCGDSVPTTSDDTLELALILFAKKLFSNE
jgi:hypothetical protein